MRFLSSVVAPLLLAGGSSSNIVEGVSSASPSSSLTRQQLRRGGFVDKKNHDDHHQRELSPPTHTVITYPSVLSDYSTHIANPERGLYVQESYYSSNRLSTKLDPADLLNQKLSTGTTIILRLYYLDTFLNSDISQDVLNDIMEDFDILRQVGIKCIIRFAYTNTQSAAVTEPSKVQLLSHIGQLTPILQSNQNIIMAVQAGFIGPWGEWHSSTHFDGSSSDAAESRGEVLEAILDAVPNRIVQIRSPRYKQQIYSKIEYPPPTSGYLSNGDFEGSNVLQNWIDYGNGYEITTAEAYSGTQSIKVDMGGAAKQYLTNLNVPEGHTVEISGYSKSGVVGGVSTGLGNDYSIYTDLTYDDGTHGWGETASFTGGTSTTTEWEYASHSIVVPAGKTLVSMSLYTMYRNDNDNPNGCVYFDDVEVKVFGLPTQIGGQVLNSTTAYDGSSDLARTGHHNDCFLASDTDYGTYEDATQSEYPYLSQDTQFTAMGGETCAANPPRSECDTAKTELELFHYSYLNSGYNQDVLNGFVTGGCMDEIRERLGYRLVLIEGEYPTGVSSSSAGGGYLPFRIQIENHGYSSPINRKRIQLVLRETTSGSICATSTINDDVRTWYGGGGSTTNQHSLEGTAVLPPGSNIPDGAYELLLNIADEDDTLKTNVDFKVKVANDGGNLNEAQSGLIDLQHSIIVGTGQPSNPVTGSQYTVTCGVENDILPPPPVITNPNSLVTNGSFEGAVVSTNWNNWRNGYEVETTTEKHSGSQCIKITSQNTADGIGGGARQRVHLTPTNNAAGSTITISGYSKSIGMSQIGVTSSFTGSDYSIYADVKYTDGTYLWGQQARFTPNSSDWEYQSHSFIVDKEVDYVTIYALYRDDPNPSAVAYFDDIELLVTPPIITNGGFEGNNVQTAWEAYGDQGYTVTTSEFNSGTQSVMVTNGAAKQCIDLVDVKSGSTIKISGCSKAVGVTLGLWDYSIYADIKYTDNTYLWGKKATFPGGTHDWICSEKQFVVTQDVESMCVHTLYRNDAVGGTAYFDDVDVTVVN